MRIGTPLIRRAVYRDYDVVAYLLHKQSGKRASMRTCENRVKTAIHRANARRGSKARGECHALVADFTEADSHPFPNNRIGGFLYAQERHVFDLFDKMTVVEVLFLAGRNCGVPLLRELRRLTRKRIHVSAHTMLHRYPATCHLIRRKLGGYPVSTTFEY